MRKAGFSAMAGIQSKFRNKLQLSSTLRLKLSQIEINVKSNNKLSRKVAKWKNKFIFKSAA